MKTLLVTGGCGFIGTNICLKALNKNYKVIALDSLIRKGSETNASFLEKNKVKIIRGDVRNYHDFNRIENKVDAIVHLAANPGIPWSIKWPHFDFSTNTTGTINVLEFSRNNGKIPVIFASTNKVYSEEVNEIPVKKNKKRYVWDLRKISSKKVRGSVISGVSTKGINENFPLDSAGKYPHSPYGASKASADLYCQEYYHIYGIPTVVNRMSCIYGLYQKGVEDQGWVDWFVRAKVKNKTLNIYGDGMQVRDALFGSDLAELYLMEIEKIHKVKGNVYNVGGGIQNTVSLLESIENLNNLDGKEMKTKHFEWRQADHKIYISDIEKVKSEVNWQPKTNFSDGINLMWKWYKNREKSGYLATYN